MGVPRLMTLFKSLGVLLFCQTLYAADQHSPPVDRSREDQPATEEGLLVLYQADDGGGQQSLNSELTAHSAGAKVLEPAYVDALINPDVAEDGPIEVKQSKRSGLGLGLSYWSLLAVGQQEKFSDLDADRNSEGIALVAGVETLNYGYIRLELSGLTRNYSTVYGESLEDDQENQSSWSLNQKGMPIRGRWLMDTVLGTFRPRVGIDNSIVSESARFPALRGASFRAYDGNGRMLTVAAGQAGLRRNELVGTFEKGQGEVAVIAYQTPVTDSVLAAFELWQFSDFEDRGEQETSGGALSIRHLSDSSDIAIKLVADSQQRKAIHADVNQRWIRYDHRLSAFYKESGSISLDSSERVARSLAYRGAYRLVGHRLYLSSGIRESETLSSNSVVESEYLNIGLNSRLGVFDSVSANIGYRRSDVFAEDDDTRLNYSLRLAYQRQLQKGVSLRTEFERLEISDTASADERQDEISLSVNWGRDESRFGLEAGWMDRQRDNSSLQSPFAAMYWDSEFSSNLHINTSLKYRQNNGDEESQSWFGNLDVDWRFSPGWLLGLRATRNEYEVEYALDGFSEDDEDAYFSQAVSLRLRHEFHAKAVRQLVGRTSRYGAGSVRGVVYYDENGDGQRQAGEREIKDAELVLASGASVITDNRGSFEYPAVAVGSYSLRLLNDRLPLPYQVVGRGLVKVRVNLRATTYVEIPVTALTD